MPGLTTPSGFAKAAWPEVRKAWERAYRSYPKFPVPLPEPHFGSAFVWWTKVPFCPKRMLHVRGYPVRYFYGPGMFWRWIGAA